MQLNLYKNYYRKLFTFILLITILSGNYTAFAQKKGTSPNSGQTAVKVTQSKQKCSSGAWTGNITYTRTQSMSDNKVTTRVSNRGKDTRDWQMKYNYRASVAVLESAEKDGSNIGKANINHQFSSVEKTNAQEENSCDRGKTFQVMSGDFQTKTETSGNASNVEANVSVGVNSDGTYTVSVGLPQIQGKVTGSETATFSGQCTKKEGKNLTLPSTQTTIEGNSLTTDGTHRINPSDPNRLSGSYSKTWQNVTETISWNLQKCGGEFRITDLRFEDMKFPNWMDWQEIFEQRGTIDGNLVRITAKVLNTSSETKYAEFSFKETYKGDKWDGARSDMPLKNDSISIRVDAGEEKEIEYVWDTSGYAWFDDGRPRLVQRVKAELWEENKLKDELTKNLKIAPKPVVLVHGLWSNWKAWETWQNIFTTSHSYDWKAFPVGEKPEKGVMDTGKTFMSSEQTKSIGENADAVKSYVKYAQEDRNAWHVDIVAHSMGGLISRYYISQQMPASPDGFPLVSHLVMLGTPNMGSPCADVMDIAFGMIGKQVEAVRQLQPDYVAGFNRINNNRKGVKFSSLAGNPLPTMCKSIAPNDGVVSVASAHWQVKDTGISSSLHTDLTGTKDFSAFVKPHLAIGPQGDHNPDLPSIPKTTGSNYQKNNGVMFMNAGYKSKESQDSEFNQTIEKSDLRPDFAKAVKLAPKQTVEIEIPIEQANDFGLTMMADSQISATLLDEKGLIVGKNLAKTPEASGWFRSIFYDKPVTKGIWKLKLENTSDKEFEVVLATWKNAVR